MTTISFARGIPGPECLPVEELAECAHAALARDGRTILSYGSAGGYAPLREWLAERHGVEQGRVLVTNGSLQAFVFLAGLLCDVPGRRVLVEAPTYDRPLRILAELGAEIVGIPVDEHGLDVGALERALDTGPPPAFLYTIPTFQNPSGRTLTEERRRRLVRLAQEHELRVLEDDPYGLVRFEGEPSPTLFELDGGMHVAYSSSFSKTIAPGVRVGYVVLPPEIAPRLEARATSTYITPALIGQATVYEFLRRGLLEPNLVRVSALLRERRDAMLDALARTFPKDARWSRPAGGYFLWVDLPGEASATSIAERAELDGVTVVRGSDFFAPACGGEASLRLAFSFVTPAEIDTGIERLAALLPAAQPAVA